MKLNQNINKGVNFIKSIDSHRILLNDTIFDQSCIIANQNIHTDLNLTNILELTSAHIQQLLESNPEIIILGSGNEHTFPKIEVLTPIAENNIGFEVMNNQSAARTYNVLVAEERKVACLLIL